MKKHGYGYLRKIEVRRADNDLYTFKESDFLRLRINDIKDMLILIVQIRLTNLLSNDVFDFAIALRMFTRSIVIQNRRDLPRDIPLVSLEVHRISKPRCDSQVDMNYNLSKPVTTHYLSKEREAASAKPHHMIASSNSRISSKNMPRFISNDMVHNHYLKEAKKKTQERSRNSEPSLMPSDRSQSTSSGSKPKPRINNQTYRNWPASKSSCITTKPIPIAEHANITNQYECEQTLDVSAGTLNLSVDTCFNSKEGGLIVSSELGLHGHNNEQSSSKLVLKVVPPASKTATSRQELELLFHHHITMLRSTFLRYDGDECDKEIMPTKIELTLEQSQQGVSNDVLVSIEGVEELKRNVWIKGENKEALPTLKAKSGSYALSWKPCQGDSLDLPDHRIRRWCCSLIPAGVRFITTCSCSNYKGILSIKIQESRKLKHKDKDFCKLWYTSFQDDAKYEHVGQDTRSQGGKRRSRQKDKDLKISD
nr:hypothetical protein [Tanacetum cinerariifolium]